ncbi:MAG: undecaprenyl/decaprenyl-phosphate alpha-N-acetylglucosaminyl 1-phosphate transferase [Planctomycetaceae bacterium]|nr:undecaprenyl/decaprenyl-phosphate alpha-N-acetylglucosaminyl 1-phosphate transferase [Planctomycetaceae bacterium]
MPTDLIILYLLLGVAAAVIALAITPLAVRLAHAARLVDRPGTRKVHLSAVPRIGGVVVVASLLAVVVPLLFVPSPVQKSLTQLVPDNISREMVSMHTKLLALLGAGVFIFAVGLIDDIRGLRARTKLLAQIVAATVVCQMGIRIDYLEINAWHPNLTLLAWPLTIGWIIAITNAVNLIDGLDGLAAGISAVTCAVIAAFALYTEQVVMAVLMVSLLGALLGFLVFNFNPAKIFLGDCGSMFLGFFLASAALIERSKTYTLVGLALPVVALGIPIFDTLFTMMRRTLDRRSMFSPDRGHIHHRLLDSGLRHRQAVVLIYAVTATAAGFGLLMLLLRDHVLAVLVFLVALVPLAVMFRKFGAMRLRETLDSLRRKGAVDRQSRREQHGFEEMQLRLREAKGFDQWWRVIRRAGRALGLARMSIELRDAGGRSRLLQWTAPRQPQSSEAHITVTLPARPARQGWTMQTTLDVFDGGELESAGRRVALFGRLLDEHRAFPPPQENTNDTNAAHPVL